MKKTLVSALTTALVVGAASTTFAAANPFQDVPANHWAYDAVAQLAKDGVVEGYGDGTYVGEAAITRYEMAQMVARAMTKSDLKHADKAMVDKLAAEFADELNNLGVRVAKLEKKIDNVKFYGIVRYTWQNKRFDKNPKHGNTNDLRIRLQMAAEVNDHWTAKGRIEYKTNLKNAKNTKGGAQDDVFMNRAYMEGNYKNLNIQLGKFPYYTMVDDGMVFDDDLAGAQVEFGKDVKVKVMAGRYSNQDTGVWQADAVADTFSIQGIEVYSKANKFTWGASYHNVKNKEVTGKNNVGLWAVGLGYHFNKDWYLKGAYARANVDVTSKEKTAYNIELDYKDADMKKPGTWGAWIAYRHLGSAASFVPTYNSMWTNEKGINLGVKAAVMQNVIGYLEYMNGKKVDDNTKMRTIFGRIEAYF